MTKKLRRKFIVFTMSIITIMLIIIMGLVYFFTGTNLENDSVNMLQNIASHPFLLHVPGELQENVRLPYFALQLNLQGEVTATGGSYYDLSDREFLKELIVSAFSSSERIGVIKEYKLRFYRSDTPSGWLLVFGDISSELSTLNNLIQNCILIGLAGFLVFLGISILLAHWAVDPVEKAWQQQRQFVADASHELKTPLTVIMTNAELMQNPDYDEESRRGFSASILVMSKQMRGLVEQMLELARADAVQSGVIFSPVDFSRLVSDALLPFEPVFFEKGLYLNSEISENIRVRGDASRLRQVVDILLDNAQKYSREKGTTRVTLQAKGKRHCLLTVANEGEEIPEQDLKNLFKRFYRADKARSRTGSFGLGLSIAESIVSRHGGKIWAESRNHVNSFFVELRCDAPGHIPSLRHGK